MPATSPELAERPPVAGRRAPNWSRLGQLTGTLLAATAVAAALGSTPAHADPGEPATQSTTSSDRAPAQAEGIGATAAPTVSFVRAARGLNAPTSIASAGGKALFITERSGIIRFWTPAGLGGRPWLDLRSRVGSEGGEQGLLGLTFHPKFAANGRAYVTYTRHDGALVLAVIETRTPGGYRVIPKLIVPHPDADNHNGGSMTWNRRGELILGTGDGGGGGDGSDNARRPGSLLGKLLIVNVDTPRTQLRVWMLGVRNPWKISTDAVTGEILVGDVGQGAFEEVDRIPYTAPRGDLGWPCREGRVFYDSRRCAGRVMTGPLAVFCHSDAPGCPASLGAEALIGGYVYRGRAYAGLLNGQYLVGDWATGNVWTVGRNGGVRRVGSLPSVTSFGQTNTGEIVAVTYDGSLWAMRAH